MQQAQGPRVEGNISLIIFNETFDPQDPLNTK